MTGPEGESAVGPGDRRLAIFHQPSPGRVGRNVFGASVANHELFQALIRQGGLDRVDFLTPEPMAVDLIVEHLLDGVVPAVQIGSASLMNQALASDCGTLMRGGPRLDDLAWLRRRASLDRSYSLIGLIHTIAPLPIRHDIATSTIAPLYPWDALVCTSPSVKSALERMVDEWCEYLEDRFGAVNVPRPMLPLVPLGVHGPRFAEAADRPAERAGMRAELGCGPDDIVVLWVGRLSYFEKAFPQPMIRAVAEAAASTGRRLHFAMVGWFPDPEAGARQYREAAAAYGPGIGFHLLDGNDRDLVGRMWAASDIFLSLVDNVQETFGITPLEAMAAGLPVVISDWDGYRYTVEHGVQGMLIPTLIGSETGAPPELAVGHGLGTKTYQQYVGVLAQHTAVDVAAAAEAIAALVLSPDLRRRMGEAGRRRVASHFDWSVVAPMYVALADELAAIRTVASQPKARTPRHPAKGDPFRDFAGFATEAVTLETVLTLRPQAGSGDLDRAERLQLDMFAGNWRGTPDEARQIVARLGAGPTTVRDLMQEFPTARRRRIQLSLLWLCKLGILAWR
ncbi:MAG: glycosyltransferase family 4 protein [Brevundimonas sp.]|uniref:glycosyltransferase family 4 protein n=1 Tax=Brevundimonas sp. TaxID=1871086 RepID=UPI0027346096|nr:glycosyltransferase family 4 protein [Brevundimonas sp.]MDP3403904.1 glycosyltransferase family 4 protein [Brevundimonas sp.]